MNYPAAELRGIKMNFYLINPDAEHRGILLIKSEPFFKDLKFKSGHLRTHNLKPKGGFRLWYSYIKNSQTARSKN